MNSIPSRLVILGLALLATTTTHAQFVIDGASNTAQTVSSGTGLVTTNGTLTLTGTTVPVTMSGTSVLTNFGTITQTGTGRAINNSAASANLVIFNGSNALIKATAQDALKTANSAITVINYGSMISSNGQVLDLRDITSQPNTVINHASGSMIATGEDAVRPGVNGVVTNFGLIQAIPVGTSGSDGIDAGGNTGVRVHNTGTIQGRHGITGGATTYAISIHNATGGLLRGVNGSGVNIDGVAATSTAVVTNESGATIEGLVDATSPNGDGDGVDVDGVVTLHNAGLIRGLGAKGVDSGSQPNNAEGVAIGGGTIINAATGQIIGSTLVGDAPNTDTTRQGNGILADNGAGGSAVAATTIDNAGLIWGKTGFGVKLVGAFDDTIYNRAGATIEGNDAPGGGALSVIQMGAGNDVITNAGAVVHSAGHGATAIALEAGNDTLVIAGGVASVQGGMDGGSGTDTVQLNIGTGNTFTHQGSITNFEDFAANSGKAVLRGPVTIDGAATVAALAAVHVNGSFAATTLTVAGTLAGTGTVNAVTTVAEGGALAPGNSIGTLTFAANLDIALAVSNLTGALKFELGAPGNHDQIVLSAGTLSIGNGLLEFDDFSFTDSGVTNGTYILFSTDSAIDGTLGGSLTGFIGAYQATLSLGDSNTDIMLTVVPEPSSFVLAGAGLLLLAWRRISRRS
jgi:hypothetical protein